MSRTGFRVRGASGAIKTRKPNSVTKYLGYGSSVACNNILIIIIIIIIIVVVVVVGKTVPSSPQPSLEGSVELILIFTSLDIATIIFYRGKSSALRPTPQPGGPGLCIYVSQ
jgi:hypothetical protein